MQQLQSALLTATGHRVSTQTVRNRLHGSGLYACRPMVCTRWTTQHRRHRRNWAEEHRWWRHAEWRSVLFSNELWFNVESDSRCVLIWGELRTWSNPAFVEERSPFGGAGLIVWAGVSIGGLMDLYIIQGGTLTAVRYRDEILRPFVLSYAGAIGD